MEELQATRTADVVAAEIRALTATMLNTIIEIGRRMCEAKEMVPYGTFGAWIRDNTGYSSSTANNFMRLYQEYGAAQGSLFGAEAECQTLGKLSYTKALALLALPPEERAEFAEEHHADEMSTRELEQAIRERNEARMAAEKASADQKAAEDARDEMARQMKTANDSLEEANRALAQSQKELAELKARPVEVAVEQVADPAAVEAARKEAMSQMQAKVDKAKAAQAKAEEKRKAAEDALAAANARLNELSRAEKKEAMAADKDLVIFQTIFEAAQEQIGKLHGYLLRYKNKGDTETAGKLSQALAALADKIKEAAEA